MTRLLDNRKKLDSLERGQEVVPKGHHENSPAF